MNLRLIQEFNEQEYVKAMRLHENVEKIRKKFVEDFPIDRLDRISLEEYLVSNKEGFCYRLQYELKDMASMGNARPDVFGIYINESGLKLSRTYKADFGGDFSKAFNAIKKDIKKLISDMKKEDYDAIHNNNLNSLFKNRLLITYYPGKLIPVIANPTLEDYCIRLGFKDNTKNTIYKNILFRNWKNEIPEFSSWSNEIFMSFCNWLRRTNKKIDGESLRHAFDKVKAQKVITEIESINLKGLDKEAIVKMRINQGIFKERLLHRYNHCCLCKVSEQNFLIASHIKPWKDSDENERLDVDNGFLFCPNHDKAFDRGYISFDNEGNILISGQLDDVNKRFLNIYEDMKIELTDGNKQYLQYHRNKYSF